MLFNLAKRIRQPGKYIAKVTVMVVMYILQKFRWLAGP